jgi:hypothetical protein
MSQGWGWGVVFTWLGRSGVRDEGLMKGVPQIQGGQQIFFRENLWASLNLREISFLSP